MTKAEVIAENVRATTEFVRIWELGPALLSPALAAKHSKAAPQPSKATKSARRRRSVTPRPADGYLSVTEVARALNVSSDTVIRRFKGLPGVIDLGHAGTRRKRPRHIFRIPQAVLDRFVKEKNARLKPPPS
jgi:hypothetical protein